MGGNLDDLIEEITNHDESAINMRLDHLKQSDDEENQFDVRIKTDDGRIVTSSWYYYEGDEEGIKGALISNSVEVPSH